MTQETHSPRLALLGRAALLTTTIIWGSAFVVMKNTLDALPVFYLLALRFLPAALLLGAVFFRRMKAAPPWESISRGFVLGALLFTAYSFQTFGLEATTPGKNAFLTTIYCVLVPFFYWGYAKVRPDRYNLIAAFLCLAGMGFVSLNEALTIQIGDGLTIISGVFYAMHMTAVAHFAKGRDVVALTVWQFVFAGLLAGLSGLATAPLPQALPPDALFSVVYLCVGATAIALLLQNVGQKVVPASSAAIILSLEAVFGALISVLFGERLSVQVCVGFALIFISIIVSETKLDFLRRRLSTKLS